MFVLAHADHPEIFFAGLLIGAALVAVHFGYRKLIAERVKDWEDTHK